MHGVKAIASTKQDVFRLTWKFCERLISLEGDRYRCVTVNVDIDDDGLPVIDFTARHKDKRRKNSACNTFSWELSPIDRIL